MPSIEALYREMMGNDDFRMVTILYRDSAENAFEYMKSRGYTFPVYIDPNGSAARDYGVTGVPETYIIDKQGKLAAVKLSPYTSQAEVQSVIDPLLGP